MLIDTHCHLSENDYENLDEVIKDMNGIMVTSGCDNQTNKEVLQIISKYDNVFGTIGIHPQEIEEVREESFDLIIKNIHNSKIVAIGEIGLDYYWVKNNKEEQQILFEKQLSIAEKYNKPVVIHTRESIQDTYDLLKNYKVTGVIHCFNSSVEMAKKFIKLGFKIGVGGVITFKNSKKLQEVVKEISLNDIVLETDSPYLTPEPFRGKKNKPSNVYYTALKIAEIKNISVEEVIQTTFNNATKLFDLKV